MDPLTIVSLVETCAGLSVTAGKLAIGLKTLAGNYQTASMTFRSLSSQCRLFACAVRAIQSWMDEAPDQGRLDDSIWKQLDDSLEVANDAINALKAELTSTSGGSVDSFWEKINVVWNMPNLKSLEDCIHKQVSSLSVILQIMSLPTSQGQKESLQIQRAVFDDSRSSAMSMADPDSSTFRGGDSASLTGAATIMTRLSQLPTFDFDEMLMASQVYLRNRNKTMALHSSNTRAGISSAAHGGHLRGLSTLITKHTEVLAIRVSAEELGTKLKSKKHVLTELETQYMDNLERFIGNDSIERLTILKHDLEQLQSVRADFLALEVEYKDEATRLVQSEVGLRHLEIRMYRLLAEQVC